MREITIEFYHMFKELVRIQSHQMVKKERESKTGEECGAVAALGVRQGTGGERCHCQVLLGPLRPDRPLVE